MKLRSTVQNLTMIALISVISIYADDGSEFNIAPSSPLDADFFDNDIPASYLEGPKERTAQNYAILQSGPTVDLRDNELYIENVPITYDVQTSHNTIATSESNINTDISTAAGTFIDDSGEVLIPENLISIESFPQTKRSNSVAVTSSQRVEVPTPEQDMGEFVSDETDGVTAEIDIRDRYNAVPKGAFSIGYQMMYMHYNEEDSSCETIYNGMAADYTFYTNTDIMLKASTSLLGGKVFNKDNGTIYSDTHLLVGKRINIGESQLSITPYTGLGLRFMNNVFAGNDAIERNTLQLYIPVGVKLDYKISDKMDLFGNIEAAAIALNQNWTTYKTSQDSTTAGFNGVSTTFNFGAEYRTSNSMTIGLSPYYQYIYTGKKSSSPVGRTDTHLVGLSAYIKF